MGRRAKYTPHSFREACDAYFRAIEYKVPVTYADPFEEDIGRKQAYTADGTAIWQTRYAVPPTLERLELALGISDQTWLNYAADPRYRDTCDMVRNKITAYLNEAVVFMGKDCAGAKFRLEMEDRRREREELREQNGTSDGRVQTMADRMRVLASIAQTFADGGIGHDDE